MKNVKHSLSFRQRQALITQQLILDVARDLFLELGYGPTTFEAISAKAGVAVSTVYSIYKNKQGILKAIREKWHLESGQRDIYTLSTGRAKPRTTHGVSRKRYTQPMANWRRHGVYLYQCCRR